MERLLQNADEEIVSFKLNEIFNENSDTIEQLNTEDTLDEVLSEIFMNEQIISEKNEEQVKATAQPLDVPRSISHISQPRAKKENVNSARFKAIDNEQVDEIASKSCKKKTHKQTTWGVKVFKDWLAWKGMDTNFEEMSKEKLANAIRQFYPSARQAPKDKEVEGKAYAKQTLINIRSGNLRDQKERGLDRSRCHPPLSREHLDQIFHNYLILHWDNDPTCLQHKVYFDIAFYLGKRGQEGLQQLKKDSFALKVNESGHKYLELTYNEATKKSPGDNNNEMNDQPILLSQDSRRCPMKSFEFYLSKFTDLPDLFQAPNKKFKHGNEKWFKRSPVGENTIGQFMKEISKNSGLSVTYTNHCIQGTTVTAMHRSGYSLHEIAQVTCHKNIESLKHYLEKPTLQDMQNYSKSLFEYSVTTNSPKGNEENSDNEFESPPKPTRIMYDKKSKKSESASEVVLYVPNTEVPSSQTSNIMQSYCQNPIGMFVGANLTNCTISINMPK